MIDFLCGVGRWCGLVLVVSNLPMAATARADELPPFPSDPVHWINSGPLTASGLKGKGVVLWSFEEECPRCRERWPGLIESAKKFEGQPVVFIAVNSGSGRSTVEDYARQVKCPWPVLVDTACGGGAIAHHAAFGGGGAIAHDFAVGGGASALHANDEIARAVLENHWMVRGTKWCASNNGWFIAAIVVLSILPGCLMPPLMYRRRQPTRSVDKSSAALASLDSH